MFPTIFLHIGHLILVGCLNTTIIEIYYIDIIMITGGFHICFSPSEHVYHVLPCRCCQGLTDSTQVFLNLNYFFVNVILDHGRK